MRKPLQPYPHSILDYMTGLLLVASPWILQFHDVSSIATNTMVTLGIVVLGLSLITDYPLGVLKAVPFKTHGVIETLGAVGLLVSPWLLGYADETGTATVFAVVVAIGWLGVVAVTNYNYHSERMVH